MSKGEFTPENGMNKGVPQPYDNLNIYASVPFPEGDMESLGAKEQQFKLKGSGNFIVLKTYSYQRSVNLNLNLISLRHRQDQF